MTSSGKLLTGRVKDRDGLAAALQEVLDAYAKLPEPDRRAKAVEGEVKPQPAPMSVQSTPTPLLQEKT